MHYFEKYTSHVPSTHMEVTGVSSLPRAIQGQRGFEGCNQGTTRVKRCYIWITMTTKMLQVVVLLFLCSLARSLTTTVLISLRLQMFQWSFHATHMKRTYRCAHVCDARCQFWRPQAPTLASHRADAGFAEDLSLERLPGERQLKPNTFTSNDREKRRYKQRAKKEESDFFFYRLCFLFKNI